MLVGGVKRRSVFCQQRVPDRFRFQSPERTLTDEDVAPLRASIVDALATRFGAVLRA